MLSMPDNDAFWRSSDLYVAADSRQRGDAFGLAEFAESREDLSKLLYFKTSGSEGLPKWVGLSRAAMLASARAVSTHLEAKANDRWLIALPIHHVGGFSILARSHVSGAGLVRWEGKWEPAAFAAVCGSEGITLTSLVPAQVYDLVQRTLPAPPTLRAVVVGGGALNRELGLRAQALGWPVLQSYGMTETASQVATEPLDHLCQGFDPERLQVLPGWDLRVDAQDRLIVQGEALASGYAVRREEGWEWEAINHAAGFMTRDCVRLCMDGTRQFLQFAGRDAGFVKILGELVNLTALQRRLEEFAVAAGVAPTDVVIWPRSDERTETELLLAGTPTTDVLETLREKFNASAPGFERLSSVRRLTRVPRGALGKVDRGAIDELMSAV